MKKTLAHTQKEQGQALVEFAAVLIILMIVLAGLLDLGRAFFVYMSLRDAAQEGATYASINPSDTTGIINRVRTTSTKPVDMADTTLINVQVNPTGALCAGNGVEVVVEYPNFTITTPLLGTILGSQSIALRARITDTILTPACE
ncbi:MAG: TadE/TadG family type IV pilus assembly protein [Chloroflexota bacterium]